MKVLVLSQLHKMSEVETLSYYDGTMGFEEPAAKRQRLDQNQFYLPPISGLTGPDFSQSDQFFDTRGDFNHDELEGAWVLNSLQTQTNEFAFSGFDATDLNLLSQQDQMFNVTNNFFANDPSYGTETLDLDVDHSFPRNMDHESNVVINTAAEVTVEIPDMDQLCFGMVLSRSSSAIYNC